MGGACPKAFLLLRDIPILVHAIRPFETCPQIRSVYIVLRQEDIRAWEDRVLKEYPFTKAKPPVVGGPTRQDSVRLGLEAIREDIDAVLIHDGVRPFVEVSLLDRLLRTLEGAPAAVPAVPAKETVKLVSSTGQVLETPRRDSVWNVQTPQAFDFSAIVEAHQRALTEGIVATDDAALIERMGLPVTVVQGSYRNIKVTTPDDLVIAQALLDHPE